MPENENEIFDLTVPFELNGTRLDAALTKLLDSDDYSRTRVQALLKAGQVKLNGEVCTLPRLKVAAGNTIHLDAPPAQLNTQATPEKIPLDVLYEDDDVLVINKPAGMVVHPAAGNWSGTVVNALLGRTPELLDDEEFDPLRPGIVHRLDKDTSGCLVIAKTPKSLRKLSRAFAERDVHKTYAAIVFGWPIPKTAIIRTQIGRHPVDRKRMAVLRGEEGKEALTSYKVVREGYWKGIKAALLEVTLFTGRTHQIRVHMSHVNYPLLGEKLYNKGRSSPAERQMLHAWKLTFPHPGTGDEMTFESPFPADFQAVLDQMTDEP